MEFYPDKCKRMYFGKTNKVNGRILVSVNEQRDLVDTCPQAFENGRVGR